MPRPSSRLRPLLLAAALAGCMAAPPSPPAPPLPTSSPTSSPLVPTTQPVATSLPTASTTTSPSPGASPSSALSPSPSIAPSPSVPPSAPATLAELHAEQLQAALEEQRVVRRIPGLAGVVVFPDGSRWRGASGLASLEASEPATPTTPFVVGSISKTFVTALVLQLAEEGVLRLDAPLARWLPEYPRARRMTLRQLLSHTSGVFNYFEHPMYERLVFGRPDHHWQPSEILETFERPPYFPPGQGFYYSNTNFILLGLVIEDAVGRPLGELLEERFIEPLGLDATHFQDSAPPFEIADGYLRLGAGHARVSDGDGFRPNVSAATVAWAAGALVSSADDLADWSEALYGGDLLAPESKAQMLDYLHSPHAFQSYALGTRTRVVLGSRSFGHTGSLRGYMAAMWHFPTEDLSVAVLTNVGRIDGNRVSDALATVVLPGLQSPLSGPTPTPSPGEGSPSPAPDSPAPGDSPGGPATSPRPTAPQPGASYPP